MNLQDTIVALSTVAGQSAIAVVRLSGKDAITIVDSFFKGKQKIAAVQSRSIQFGKVMQHETILDEVVVAVFNSPASYTGDHVVEISCHGSMFIVQSLLSLCIQAGARMAQPGEFTQRAFLAGKLDLSQAESVAELIASENESQHRIAMQQMRGNYSKRIQILRQELIDFAALLELELDFSEEDVEFANREKFILLIQSSKAELQKLIQSFSLGNVLKNGVPVAIVGKPNVGKSTLLNKLLQEEKAMVSDIPGTTRDFIEDTIQLGGITYRFIDTAGIRESDDRLETMGIERSFEKMKEASIILYVADIGMPYTQIAEEALALPLQPMQKLMIVLNKSDLLASACDAYDIEEAVATITNKMVLEISANSGRNVSTLLGRIQTVVEAEIGTSDVIVSNTRHVSAMQIALDKLEEVRIGLDSQLHAEFLAIDVRAALQALGSITGGIGNEDVLSSIFSRFCIGK